VARFALPSQLNAGDCLRGERRENKKNLTRRIREHAEDRLRRSVNSLADIHQMRLVAVPESQPVGDRLRAFVRAEQRRLAANSPEASDAHVSLEYCRGP